MPKRREPIDIRKLYYEPEPAVSREYKIFRKEERLSAIPRTLYEKACNASIHALKVQPDKKTEKKLQEAIEFSHLKTTPNGVASLTIIATFAVTFPSFASMLMNALFGMPGLTFSSLFIMLLIALPFIYYLYIYPLHLKKKYEISVGSDTVTMILYMAMHMRNMPNLENAIRFSSENITGDLGQELKKMLWDIEVGNFITAEEALIAYTKKWEKNKEFVQAVELLISSLRRAGAARITLLNEAVDIMLAGNREQAKHFNQQLKMPVMIVHALGIVLPVMGLVLFPIIAIFLGVDATILFVLYDVLLPLVLFFVITNIMETRPATFSRIDISENPDVPPGGRFRYRRKNLPAWPFGLAAAAAFMLAGLMVFGIEGQSGILPAILMLGSAAFGFSAYYILLSNQRLSVRDSTKRIESEFAEALFQMGNEVSGGVPIEMSMENSMKRMENLKIKEMFQRALTNMKTLGLTFSQAFFDKAYGAIRYYPSRLIKSVMRTVVESSQRGVQTAAVSMISVSAYLKGLHQTQEEVVDELNDTINSLKFQAYFLSPMISGIIVTMAIMMIRILEQLASKVGTFQFATVPLFAQISNMSITPFQFILVVGIYLIETCFILGMFISEIESGDDPITRQSVTGRTLLAGFIVFSISLFISLWIFGPLTMIA